MEQSDTPERKQKTSKSRRETAVQGTNDNSIVSKCSMSAAGYFNDPLLEHFVAKTTRRAPLINRGYYIRAVCIDQVLRQFFAKYQGCRKQVVSLGAGFDSAYFRLKSDGLLQEASFYEIDFPEVTKRKHAIIQSNSTLSSLLNFDGKEKKLVPPIELSTSDYCLLGVDLTQLNTLEAALRLCGADFDTPTLLLSECVMTYMTRRCSSALVKWAGETFQDAFFIMYEQINPDDAFGIFMQNHFHTIGSPLKCITSFPTVESQIKRFLDLGWQKCKCHDLNEIYRYTLSVKERARIETLDPFDEYEEFNLKCAHYFLLVASTSSSISDFIFTASPAESTLSQPNPVAGMVSLQTVPVEKSSIKRFSHSSVLVADRYIMTAGGFGEVDGRHQRVQEVSVTDTVSMETRLIRCRSEDIQYSRMHHSSVVLSDGRVLLLGGRQSPFFLCSQLLVLDLIISSDSAANQDIASNPQGTVQGGVDEGTIHSGLMERTSGTSDTERNKERNCAESGDSNFVRNTCDVESGSNCAVCDTHTLTLGHPDHVSPRTSSSLDVNSIRTSVSTEENAFSSRPTLVTEREERTDFEGGYLVSSVLQQSGDIPCPRWRHATSLVSIEGRDCVFLHGGRTQKAEVLSDTYLLDVCTGVWTQAECKGDHPGHLHSHSMVTWEERGVQQVVVVGGVDGDQNPQSSIYVLDLPTLTWRRLHVSGIFLSRYSHTCHMVGDRLVVVGGVNLLRHTPGIGIINLCTGQALEFSFPTVSRNQMLMYHRHGSVMLLDGKIILLGGGGNCFSFGTHLNQTPVVVDIARCLEAAP